MSTLTAEHFCDETWRDFYGQTALPAEEAVQLVTPEVYREALEYFLKSWQRSLTLMENPEDPEHMGHIRALEATLAHPDLLGEMRDLLFVVPALENPEGFTHVICYSVWALSGLEFPFKAEVVPAT